MGDNDVNTTLRIDGNSTGGQQAVDAVVDRLKNLGAQATQSGAEASQAHEGAAQSAVKLGDALKNAYESPQASLKSLITGVDEDLVGALGAAAAGAAVAGVAILGALAESAVKAVELGETLQDVAYKLDTTASNAAALKYAFDVAGGSIDQASNLLFMMQQRMENNPKQFTEGLSNIHLSLQDIQGLDPVDMFLKIDDAFQKNTNSSNRAGTAMDLFGRQGRDAISILMKPLSDLNDQFQKNIGYSNEAAKDAEELGMAWRGFKEDVSWLGTEVGTKFLHALEMMTGTGNWRASQLAYSTDSQGNIYVSNSELGTPKAPSAPNLPLGRAPSALDFTAGFYSPDVQAGIDSLTLQSELLKVGYKKPLAGTDLKGLLPGYQSMGNGYALGNATGGYGLAGLQDINTSYGIPDQLYNNWYGYQGPTSADLPGGLLASTPLVGYGSRFGAASGYAPSLIPGYAGIPNTKSPFANVGRDLGIGESAISFFMSGNQGTGQNLLSGAETGANAGAVAGPLGAAIGGGIGLLAGGIKSLFGGPSQNELQSRSDRDSFMATYGGTSAAGIQNLANALAQAGINAEKSRTQIAAMLDAKTPQAFQAALKPINDELKIGTDAQNALNDALSRYKFTEEQLGPALQRQNLDQQAQQLYKDWNVLTAAQISSRDVLTQMSGNLNQFVADSRHAGVEVPAAMQPMIEQAIKFGLITDDNGNVITDLKDSGITFSQTMTQGFQSVVSAVKDLSNAIKASLGIALDDVTSSANTAAAAIDNLNHTQVQPGGMPGISDDGGPPAFATEAYVRYPTLATVGDAPGGEWVLKNATLQRFMGAAASAGAAAMGEGGTVVHIDASGSMFTDQASMQKLARVVGDAMQSRVRNNAQLSLRR